MQAMTVSNPRTLIADDQPDVLAALSLLLNSAGYQTEAVTSPAAVIDALRKRDFDVVLMDLNYARDTTSGQEGLDLLSSVQTIDMTLPIVVMTAWATVDLAVEAMRRGVRDFIEKPWENSRLLQVLRGQIEQGRKRRRLRQRASERRERNRKLQVELEEAREIQQSLMCANTAGLEGFDLSYTWRAARTIGGDYLAVFPVGTDRTALCVADVAGKGLPAALMMSNMQAALKSAASAELMPSDLCARLNQLMWGNTSLNKFITCFYGLLDVRRRVLVFANAGHNSPMLIRRSGQVQRLQSSGRVLGAFEHSTYQQDEVELQPGDRLLLFTDGVTEVRNPVGDEFGEQRLCELLVKERRRSATELQSLIMNTVTEFCANHFDDDAALMVLSVK